jgi:hypothetical protein
VCASTSDIHLGKIELILSCNIGHDYLTHINGYKRILFRYLDDDWVEFDEFWHGIEHLLATEPREHRDEEAHVGHSLVVQVTHSVHQLRRRRRLVSQDVDDSGTKTCTNDRMQTSIGFHYISIDSNI